MTVIIRAACASAFVAGAALMITGSGRMQAQAPSPAPAAAPEQLHFHHVHLNSTDPAAAADGKIYCKWGGFIAGID